MAVNQSTRPYYDRFNADKNYTKILFNPDRPLQNSELNELQSTIDYYMQTMGDAILKDGDIISGLDFDITTHSDKTRTINVQSGLLYVSGKVRQYNGGKVTIKAKGEETLNVSIAQTAVTAESDPTLLDPSIGSPSEKAKGADRLKDEVRLLANDASNPAVYEFLNGQLLVTPNTDSTLMNILAERTFDESGSYTVKGYELQIDTSGTMDTDDTLSLVIKAGRAYIRGYKVDKPHDERVSIRKSKDVRTANSEPKTYTDASRRLLLSNSPVSNVTQVMGSVSYTEAVARTATTLDQLGKQNVIAITSIVSSKGTAIQGVDFNLTNNQYIQWVTGSNKIPVTGTTYTVVYTYTLVFTKGVDYSVKVDKTAKDSYGFPISYVDFNGHSGSKPINNSTVYITYDFYLARKDLVVLDPNGRFTVIEGQPDAINVVDAPTQSDNYTLRIGTVTAYPDSKLASVNSYTVKNMPFEELQKLKARVMTAEANITAMSADISSTLGYDATSLRGVFSDNFTTIDRVDYGFKGMKENGKPIIYVANSFEDGELTTAYAEQNSQTASIINSTTSKGFQGMNTWGRVVTAPYKRIPIISQLLATETKNVNPYMVFATQVGALKLKPSADNWIDTETITVNNTKIETKKVNRWWAHGGDTWNSDSQFIKENENAINWEGGAKEINKHNSWTHDRSNPLTGTLVTNGGKNTIETAIEYMRVREITIASSGLRPYAENVYLVFNGIRCAITPTGSTTAGSKPGTVKATGAGKVTGKFTIPSGQTCGTVEVTLSNEETAPNSNEVSIASASYSAHGTKKTTEKIINTTHITVNLYDPLAQSFQVPEDRILSGVGVYFSSKDAGNVPVVIQIRGMSDGGQPNSTVYAERVLYPADITTSKDGNVETPVYFDDPLMVSAGQSYSLVVLTNSAKYNMYIATMGSTIIGKGNTKLQTQAYTKGVLFSSSNAQTWTAHQTSDMKFQVYGTEFKQGNATILFDTIKDIQVDKLLLTASYLTPKNTGCKWELRFLLNSDSGDMSIESKPWLPVGNYSDVDPNEVVRIAQLRATFKANQYMSPVFALDDFSLMSFVTEVRGSYFGKTVSMGDAPFNTIYISYKQYLPSPQCKVLPKFYTGEKADNGLGMLFQKPEDFSSVPVISQPDVNGFVNVSYTVSLGSLKTKKLFKVRMDLESPSGVLRPRVSNLRVTLTDE
ncbi:gp108 [Brochothrix phage A9]|uniref:Gp108 n=1 Tax=Brochothrix phage A9 TaxID=857312 RepID=D9J0Q5_9CAUD|nr:gp108 [Brochothrix phage A9]ADJ53142.1 gp108 [Brochothrix phage A9]